MLKKLPLSKFGELLQCLYDCEHHFQIEWMWDGGFDFGFGCNYSGIQEASEPTKELAQSAENRDIEVVGGLIIHDYLQKFDGKDSDGRPNKMFQFCKENGFIDHYSQVESV